jgi:hypothetical protein
MDLELYDFVLLVSYCRVLFGRTTTKSVMH